MGKQNEPVEICCTVLWVTDQAILIEDCGNEVWLPLSQIEGADGLSKGDYAEIEVPEWLALEKGLI